MSRPALVALLSLLIATAGAEAASITGPERPPIGLPEGFEFIDTRFENASPLYWEADADGALELFLLYDHERSAPNRAAGHWHFRVHARPGTFLTIVLNNFDNVWNGRQGSPVSENTVAWVSDDGANWRPVETDWIGGNRLRFEVRIGDRPLYVARLEPYRISDLDRLIERMAGDPRAAVIPIGRTVEDRELEILRVGDPRTPHIVLLRARAHPWEPGGNWVIEGLIERLLAEDALAAKYRNTYCLYALPMANMDGVARGLTRFNVLGMDLNRNWGKPADPRLAPENHALERWLEGMIARRRSPDLAIDFHNDEGGRLHISRPEAGAEGYLRRMQRFEELLRDLTWFTEGSTGESFRNPGTFGEGLLARYGIDACVHELNANWIAGLEDYPSAAHWKRYGADLAEVFYRYFVQTNAADAPVNAPTGENATTEPGPVIP